MQSIYRAALFSILFSCLLSSQALAQSYFYEFMETSTGALDMREVKISGKFAAVKVSARTLTRMATGETRKAVYIQRGNGVKGPEVFFVYIDQDELPQVIAFIKDVLERFETTEPKPDQMLTYRTRSGLYIGGHYFGKWKGVIGSVHDDLNELRRADLDDLREELEEARVVLEQGFVGE